jgi:acetylornithine deacetylase/succinyl-diaminopimelate desuccinylase-like protein
MQTEQTLQRTKQCDDFANAIRREYEHHLKSLVDIPSISADPAHKKDIKQVAETAAALIKKLGGTAEVLKTEGNPVVFGEFKSKSSKSHLPTLTVYNHLDVQPAEAGEWRTPPFSLTVEGDLYRGRGATDDKGPALAALYAAKFVNESELPINIKFIWELEEEIGSPHFASFLKANRSKLDTNSVMVSDTIWIKKDKPSISYGLRGLCCALIKLKTGKKDVHSGTTGGLARNPIGELSQLLSECYNAQTGIVKIPGFYDDILAIEDEELDNMERCGFSMDNFRQAHELTSLRTNDPEEALTRIWTKPTFEVHGIAGGYTGPGVKTVVPYQAEAKISMRLVPNQKPEKIFQLLSQFVKSKCPEAEVIPQGMLSPYLGSYNDKFNQAAKQAVRNVFGREAVFTREGGSIGAVVSMHDILRAPVVFLGLSLPEHGYHAVNEYFDWQQAQGGIKLFADYFSQAALL